MIDFLLSIFLLPDSILRTLTYGGENSPIGALNFYPVFLASGFGCQRSALPLA